MPTGCAAAEAARWVVVEHQQPGAGGGRGQRAGQGDALPLAAGDAHAEVTDAESRLCQPTLSRP